MGWGSGQADGVVGNEEGKPPVEKGPKKVRGRSDEKLQRCQEVVETWDPPLALGFQKEQEFQLPLSR